MTSSSKPPAGDGAGRDAGEGWSARRIVVTGFAAAILAIAGVGFIYKMTEFATTIARDDVEGFGAVAVSIYLIGVLPIVFLTLWAVLTGRFRDVERPKYRMLELDREIERGGELGGGDVERQAG
jgi:nitrogen fixation-related uncharacterized protein